MDEQIDAKRGIVMNYRFNVIDEKKTDVIICSDAKNEADDQYAITHALLSPKLNVLGIIGSHFGNQRSDRSMMDSYLEIVKIGKMMDYDPSRIYKGIENPISDRKREDISDGARFIIDSTLKSDKEIYIGVMGPLSDVAEAVLTCKEIAEKIHIIWTGTTYQEKEGDPCREANSRNDIEALNIVMEYCPRFLAIPYEVYSKLQVSLAELQNKVFEKGEIGTYLFEQLEEVNRDISRKWALGESWCLGDNAVVGALLNRHCVKKERKQRYMFEKNSLRMIDGYFEIAVDINERFVLEDFFSKMQLISEIAR